MTKKEYEEICRRLSNGPVTGIATISDLDTGEILDVATNKTLIGATQIRAMRDFNIKEFTTVFPDYNQLLNITDGVVTNVDGILNADHHVALFCCGTSGAGDYAKDIYPVVNNGIIHPSNLIPFRYESADKDIPQSQREVYFGRKEDGGKIYYYYKRFDKEPRLRIEYDDGTPITNNIYINNQNEISTDVRKINVFVELSLRITKSDLRDWFIVQPGGLDKARFNCIQILSCWFRQVGINKIPQDVTPHTRFNFKNKGLEDLTKGYQLTYHVYY